MRSNSTYWRTRAEQRRNVERNRAPSPRVPTLRELQQQAEREAFERGRKEGITLGRKQEKQLHAHADPANHEKARKNAWYERGRPRDFNDKIPEGWPEDVKNTDHYTEQYIDLHVMHDVPDEPEQQDGGEFTQQLHQLNQENQT